MKALVCGYFNDYNRKKVEYWLVWISIPSRVKNEEDFTIEEAKRIACEKVAKEVGSPVDEITVSDFTYIGTNPKIIK